GSRRDSSRVSRRRVSPAELRVSIYNPKLSLHNILKSLPDRRVRVTRQRRDSPPLELKIRFVSRDPYQLIGRCFVGEARINTDQRASQLRIRSRVVERE